MLKVTKPPDRPAGNRGLPIPRFLASLFLLVLLSCQSAPRITVETLPLYEAAFQRTSGWTGGDGAYSAALGGGRFLWLFGDTFVGEVKEGRRINDLLINNSVAIQVGKQPQAASIDFFYKVSPDGRPAPFVEPEDGSGWFWPYHAVRTAEGLYLFLLWFERDENIFPFKLVSTWLGNVSNPEEPPERWILSQRKIPWGSEQRQFGSYVLKEGEYCYVYGTVVERVQGGREEGHDPRTGARRHPRGFRRLAFLFGRRMDFRCQPRQPDLRKRGRRVLRFLSTVSESLRPRLHGERHFRIHRPSIFPHPSWTVEQAHPCLQMPRGRARPPHILLCGQRPPGNRLVPRRAHHHLLRQFRRFRPHPPGCEPVPSPLFAYPFCRSGKKLKHQRRIDFLVECEKRMDDLTVNARLKDFPKKCTFHPHSAKVFEGIPHPLLPSDYRG